MNKIWIVTLIMSVSLMAIELPTAQAKKRVFGESVELNAKVIQLSNAQQSIMSMLNGYIENYYVRVGENVKANQKIALIKSTLLSKMTSNYISLKKQFISLDKNYKATKRLYKKGMTSMLELNRQSIRRDSMLSKILTLKSQLKTLGIDANKLKKASSNYILYTHNSGVVSNLIQPLHSVVNASIPIVSIVKSEAFYIKSYLPLRYANVVKIGQKIVVSDGDKKIVTHIKRILPKVDEKTQRIVLLSSVDERVHNLYINAYINSTYYFNMNKKYLSVKKSALSFFDNEWVVFIPNKEDSYEPRVVKIITQDENYVAVKGLQEGEEYVSDKSYYAKSMLLKSSLGDGD